MICKNCSKELPDNAVFCGGCGEKVVTDIESKTDVITEPQHETEKHLVGKQKYLLKYSGKTTKLLTFISWATALICIGLLMLSCFISLNSSITKITSVKYALEVEAVEEEYDIIMTDFIDSRNDFCMYRERFDDIVKIMDDTIDEPSVNNIEAFSESFEDISQAEIDTFRNRTGGNDVVVSYEWLDNTLDVIAPVVFVVKIVIFCFMILCGAFILISGAFRLNGLAITGFFFSVLYSLLFTNILFVILISVFALATTVLLVITNIKYRRYKKTFYIPKPLKKGV